MGKRKGRPKARQPLSCTIKFNVTVEMLAEIQRRATADGGMMPVSPNEWVRKALSQVLAAQAAV